MNTTPRSEMVKQLAIKLINDWRINAHEDEPALLNMILEAIDRYCHEKQREIISAN